MAKALTEHRLPYHLEALFRYIEYWKATHKGRSPKLKHLMNRFGKVKTTLCAWLDGLRAYGLIETEREAVEIHGGTLLGQLSMKLDREWFNTIMAGKASELIQRARAYKARIKAGIPRGPVSGPDDNTSSFNVPSLRFNSSTIKEEQLELVGYTTASGLAVSAALIRNLTLRKWA